MIARMTGTISEVYEDHVILDRDGIGHEVLVCGYAVGELSACLGQQATLHTMEYYEASGVGGNLIPRLVGFLHAEDRAFFGRFITVKGIGTRKALKALIEPTGSVAAAIESGDDKALTRLPGIGKRAAQQIIAELKGKVEDFAVGAGEIGKPPHAATHKFTEQQRDALEVMIALGERRADAERWLERVIQLHPAAREADEWVRLVYRVKSGIEG